jgi:hypothetical protein
LISPGQYGSFGTSDRATLAYCLKGGYYCLIDRIILAMFEPDPTDIVFSVQEYLQPETESSPWFGQDLKL